ncbi:MAG: YgjV family protein [Firmicutes bacterium]|nr:YgjV family protein [Bacillota bacterium]
MENWFEWLGYLASLIVLVSLLMSSIIKLRWINLLGSSIFSLYGFLIGSFPVGFMNLGISIINIYYLIKIYSSNEYFKILPIESNSQYLNYFLDFYKEDIKKHINLAKLNIEDFDISFYILRDMVPAGIFLARKYNETTLKVELDFVIPEYRDFKIGNYIYVNNKDFFLKNNYHKLVDFSSNEKHIKYLKKMGFKEELENEKKYFIKSIN